MIERNYKQNWPGWLVLLLTAVLIITPSLVRLDWRIILSLSGGAGVSPHSPTTPAPTCGNVSRPVQLCCVPKFCKKEKLKFYKLNYKLFNIYLVTLMLECWKTATHQHKEFGSHSLPLLTILEVSYVAIMFVCFL